MKKTRSQRTLIGRNKDAFYWLIGERTKPQRRTQLQRYTRVLEYAKIRTVDCSQSPIFSWDRLDIPRLNVTGILIFKCTEGAGFGDYSSGGRRGEGGAGRGEKNRKIFFSLPPKPPPPLKYFWHSCKIAARNTKRSISMILRENRGLWTVCTDCFAVYYFRLVARDAGWKSCRDLRNPGDMCPFVWPNLFYSWQWGPLNEVNQRFRVVSNSCWFFFYHVLHIKLFEHLFHLVSLVRRVSL